MKSIDDTRRTVLKATGASLAIGLVAGCLGGDGDGSGGGDDDGDDGVRIDPGTQILLEGNTGGYEGLEPAGIEGATNPTLILEDGGEYEIGWTQGDGGNHNVQLWDADEEIVGDYELELTTDPGDGEFLPFTATDEIAHYRCNPHPGMQGTIRVE